MVDDIWKEVVVNQIFMKCIYKALRGREDFDTRHDIDRLRPHSCNGSKYIRYLLQISTLLQEETKPSD